MIVRTGEDSPQERYWQDAAASITAVDEILARLLRVSGEWASGMPRRSFSSYSRDRVKPSARLWPNWKAFHTIPNASTAYCRPL